MGLSRDTEKAVRVAPIRPFFNTVRLRLPALWLAYISTHPMGASFGDLLSQPVEKSSLGFGTVVTSLLFLTAIVRRSRYFEG